MCVSLRSLRGIERVRESEMNCVCVCMCVCMCVCVCELSECI